MTATTPPPPPPPPPPGATPDPSGTPTGASAAAIASAVTLTRQLSARPAPATSRPRLGRVLLAEYTLLLRSVCTRGRMAAIGTLAAISVLTAMLVRIADPLDPLDAGARFVNANVATLIAVAVLVFGAAALGDLIDDGSLVYLWLRPVPTWVHVVAAWAATVTVTVPLVLGPIVLAAAMIEPAADLLVATVVAGLVAIAGYGAVFVMAGVRFRRPLPWGLVYILIWEGFVASAGETATRLAIRSYVRSILASITGIELKLGEFTLASGIAVPLLVAVVALAYATRRLARTDVA